MAQAEKLDQRRAAVTTAAEPPSAGELAVDAAAARAIADEYLTRKVGDLLLTKPPHPAQNGIWTMDVFLTSARRGELGQVGHISVDAGTGEVLFSEDDRAEVKALARALARCPAS